MVRRAGYPAAQAEGTTPSKPGPPACASSRRRFRAPAAGLCVIPARATLADLAAQLTDRRSVSRARVEREVELGAALPRRGVSRIA